MRGRCDKESEMRGNERSITEGYYVWHGTLNAFRCPFIAQSFRLFLFFFSFAFWDVSSLGRIRNIYFCSYGRVWMCAERGETFICTNWRIYYETSDLNFYLLVTLLLAYAFAFCLSWVEVSDSSARKLSWLSKTKYDKFKARAKALNRSEVM